MLTGPLLNHDTGTTTHCRSILIRACVMKSTSHTSSSLDGWLAWQSTMGNYWMVSINSNFVPVLFDIFVICSHFSPLLRAISVKQEHLLSMVWWVAMAERFSVLDLCSDGRVVRTWVRILAATVVLMSLSKTLNHNCFSSPRSINGEPVWAEMVIVFD